MENQNEYAAIALKALQRAAAKVAEDARKNNYKIPVWRNGHIEYKVSEIATKPNAPRAEVSPKPWEPA